MDKYTPKHARAGLSKRLPQIECFPNQFRNYEITIVIPEFTSLCPKTGQPDFGTITVKYTPDKDCVELKSFKVYIGAYRNLGIFYENAVNRILEDFVAACKPIKATVTGEFNPRGGMRSTVEAHYPRNKETIHKIGEEVHTKKNYSRHKGKIRNPNIEIRNKS